MSSWLSLSAEIALNQTPDIPDHVESTSDASKPSYSVSLLSEASILPVAKTLIRQVQGVWQGQPATQRHAHTLQPTTPRDRILRFGASYPSQLPKPPTGSTRSSSSLWNLLSTHTSKPLHNLVRSVLSPQDTQPGEATETEAPSPQPTQSHSPQSSQTTPTRQYERPLYQRALLRYTKLCIETLSFLTQQTESPEDTSLFSILQEPYSQESSQKDQQQKQQKDNFFMCICRRRRKRAAAVVPVITPPTIGVFTLSYLLTKQGILADYASYATCKENIDTTQKELDTVHLERLKGIEKNIKKEASEKKWSDYLKVAEWVMPFVTIAVAAVSIILTGGVVGLIGLIAGLLSLALLVADTYNVWEKLEKYIPSSNPETRRKVVQFIRLSLHVAAFVCAVVSLRFEYIQASPVMAALVRFVVPVLQVIVHSLRGMVLVLRSKVLGTRAEIAELEAKSEELGFDKDDYFEKGEEKLNDINSAFEEISRILNLMKESDYAFLNSLKT